MPKHSQPSNHTKLTNQPRNSDTSEHLDSAMPPRVSKRIWWIGKKKVTTPAPSVSVAEPTASKVDQTTGLAAARTSQADDHTGTPPAIRQQQKGKRPHLAGEVQRSYVSARTIVNGNMLCLRPTGAPATSAPGSRDSYCAILEVTPINFLLRSEEEQADIIAGFGTWLNSLRFPVQILVQVRRLDLGPYVSRLRAAVTERVEALDNLHAVHVVQERWVQVATDHVTFVQGLARKKLLLERHFYVILTSQGETGSTVASGSLAQHIKQLFVHWRRSGLDALAAESLSSSRLWRGEQLTSKNYRRFEDALRTWQLQASAQRHLDLHVAELTRQFERLGLEVKRVEDEELATLYYRALTPERATLHPLPPDVVVGLDLPIEPSSESSRTPTRHAGQRSPHGAAPAQTLGKLPPSAMPLLPRQRDFTSLSDLLAPASVELSPGHLCLEGEYSRVLAVTGYPRRVFAGWLAHIIDEDMPLDVSLHIHPRDARAALRTLRRHLAQYEASAALDHQMGRLPDPQRRIAVEDVTRLQERIERGTTHVFDFGLYVRLYATRQGGLAELEHRTEQAHGAFDHLGVVARPSLWEQDLAFASILPQGRDALHRTRFFDTETIATAWPFSTSSISMSEGILFGLVPCQRELRNP